MIHRPKAGTRSTRQAPFLMRTNRISVIEGQLRVQLTGLVTQGQLSQVIHGGNMGTSLWVFGAVVVFGVGWFSYEVVRLLKEIADELRYIRRYLEGVSGELEKISGPLGYVQEIYGLGERVLGRSEKK